MADLIGQKFGNYRLTALLGKGGFAEVYLGEHMRLGMQAAVKILHTNLEGEEIAAFQQEARTIAELIHPHIIRVLDFDIQNGTPFLVLDYAPNGSLRQRHKRGDQVPLNLVGRYVTEVADALQYAHDRKHIHRDIKPENMLIGRHDEILLTDFGIASVAHSTSSMSTQAPMGTLAYMSPEQIQGYPRPASDQYALAVTVYQWLTGVMPFRGSSAEIIGQQIGKAPPPLRSILADIPTEVEQVVMTALAKEPRERFSSMRAFADAFLSATHGLGSRTFSFTDTTVVKPKKGAQQVITPPFAPQPSAEKVLNQGYPHISLPAGGGQRGTQSQTAYWQPAPPYVPPQVSQRAGLSVFVQGLTLGSCLVALSFVALKVAWMTLLIYLAISAGIFFLWGLWAALKNGLVRSSFSVSILGSGWLILLNIILFNLGVFNAISSDATVRLSPSLYLIVSAAGICVALLGGLIGRSIYNARQPIHPPAGGAGFSDR